MKNLPTSSFCYWLLLGVIYWRLKKQVHTGNFIKQTGAWVAWRTIHSYNTQAPRCQAGHQLSHRLEEDGLQTWTVEMWDCHWCQISSRYHSALILSPVMISLVYSVREMPPKTITLTPPNAVTLSVQQSIHTLTPQSNCCRGNLDSSVNILFLHMLKFQCSCCRHQQNWAWWWKAVMVGFLEALLDQSSVYGS